MAQGTHEEDYCYYGDTEKNNWMFDASILNAFFVNFNWT